jgi:protein-tyrosine phosphatase
VCRSPIAERLTRATLAPAAALDVVSAGLSATPGRPIDPDSAAALRELGGDPDGFTATLLDAHLLDGAALVVTMTHAQRSQVLRRFPRALRRTFVLSETAALAPLIDGQTPAHRSGPRLEALAAAFAAARSTRAGGPTGDPDVGDPIGQPAQRHREVAGQIRGHLHGLLGLLTDVPTD